MTNSDAGLSSHAIDSNLAENFTTHSENDVDMPQHCAKFYTGDGSSFSNPASQLSERTKLKKIEKTEKTETTAKIIYKNLLNQSPTKFSFKKLMPRSWCAVYSAENASNAPSVDILPRDSSPSLKINKFGLNVKKEPSGKDGKKKSSVDSKIGLMRSKLYNSIPNLHNFNQMVFRKQSSVSNINKLGCKLACDYENDENIKKILRAVEKDHVVSTNAGDNKIRRTLCIERGDGEKYGFTLQSYSFRSVKNDWLERVTYVDHVVLNSPAFFAGLRAGDVILAINGRDVQRFSHKTLVQYITDHVCLRMVVLFENCVDRIDLCAKAVKLKKLVSDKIFEYNVLNMQERRLLSGLPLLSDDEIFQLLCNSPLKSSLSNFDYGLCRKNGSCSTKDGSDSSSRNYETLEKVEISSPAFDVKSYDSVNEEKAGHEIHSNNGSLYTLPLIAGVKCGLHSNISSPTLQNFSLLQCHEQSSESPELQCTELGVKQCIDENSGLNELSVEMLEECFSVNNGGPQFSQPDLCEIKNLGSVKDVNLSQYVLNDANYEICTSEANLRVDHHTVEVTRF